jgi:hypothetical protein
MSGLTERPAVGDELVMVSPRSYYEKGWRFLEYVTTPVHVVETARFKIRVMPNEEFVNTLVLEFDWRTGHAWNASKTYAYTGPEVYTPEGWTEHRIRRAAEKYLSTSGVHLSSLRGTLSKEALERTVELANLLREFEGLEKLQ